MTPEQKAREAIDQRLIQSGWILQDMRQLNPMAAPGVAVREFPTSTGPVDYALFIDGIPVGVVEAKADEKGENITTAEAQSSRYARSTFKWVKTDYRIRFAYEATGKLTRFTDYKDQKYRSRRIFSFHRPESLRELLKQDDTTRNNMKHFPPLDTTGFRDCQVTAIHNLEKSFGENRPRALIQMATGAGKTFTAITAVYVQYLAEPKKDRIFSIIGIPLENLGVFFKHHAFYDENEFRIVLQDHIFPGKPGLYKIDYRIKDGVFIPYTKLEFPAEAIKSIGISPSEKQQMAEFSVERMLGPKYHLNYGDFFRSKIPYSP